jgi:hypothetical protein
MDKANGHQNQIFTENVNPPSQISSLTYDEANDLKLATYNSENKKNCNLNLEKVSTVKTEKYDAELGGLAALETHKTSNYCSNIYTIDQHFLYFACIDVTIASIIKVPNDAFYNDIPEGGYGWYTLSINKN